MAYMPELSQTHSFLWPPVRKGFAGKYNSSIFTSTDILHIKENHLLGLLTEIKTTSKRLLSTGACILEVSIKEGFGVSEAPRNTQHSGFVGDPTHSAVAARRKDSIEAGGWPSGRSSGKAGLALLIGIVMMLLQPSLQPALYRGRLGKAAGA